jgi:hypothetical protein
MISLKILLNYSDIHYLCYVCNIQDTVIILEIHCHMIFF